MVLKEGEPSSVHSWVAVGFQLAADSFIQILGYLIDQDTPSKCVNDAGDKLDLKPPVLGLKGAPLSSSLIFIYHIICI